MSALPKRGGSGTGTTGGQETSRLLQSLNLPTMTRQIGQELGQAGQQQVGVQPGNMAMMSPQQRFAMVMRMYQGQ